MPFPGGKSDHLVLPVDVSVARSVQSLIADIRGKFGSVPSVVVNSAGITRDNFLLKMEENSWNAVMNINLKVFVLKISHTKLILQTLFREHF